MRVPIYNKNSFSSKVEATNQSSVAAVQEVEGEEGDECSFEVFEPSRWKTPESKLEGVNERRLDVAEGEIEGRGVLSYFGTKMDVGEGAVGSKLNAVVDKGAEGSDKQIGVIIKLCVARDGA